MSGILRPSAGYIGRGVTDQVAVLCMLYHQKSLAQVNAGSRRRAASQTFSPPTSRFDWRQNQTSARSWKYQPLATTPWSRGRSPVVRVACTEHVTAGRIVRSGRAAPSRARAARLGVASPTRSPVRPTTRRTIVRCIERGDAPGSRDRPEASGVRLARAARGRADAGGLAAQDRIPFEEPALVDGRVRLQRGAIQLAALGEERHRVVPGDAADVGLRDAALAHQGHGLRHLERITHAPVRGAVDQDPLAAVALHERHHARLVHLRERVDGVAGPAPGREHERQRLLGVVVDEDTLRREADVLDQGEAPLGAALLVPVRRVDEDRQLEAEGELELSREVLLLLGRLVVVADLPDRDHTVLGEIAGQELDHARRDAAVVRLLRIERQGAEMVDAELARPKALPAKEPVEVVLEGAHVSA